VCGAGLPPGPDTDRAGHPTAALFAVARDDHASEAVGGHHVIQLALERDPQAEFIVSMD
jgi:hypothetical protein